jgi:pimeloyl-ACP methyl ester carboxylesterase
LIVAAGAGSTGFATAVERLDSDGVEVAYLDRGEGPAIILGHCSSASHKEWLPLIEKLSPDWHVLAPDFIGYGQSGPLAGGQSVHRPGRHQCRA